VEKPETKEKLYRIHAGTGKKCRATYQIRDEVLLVLAVPVGDRKEVYRPVMPGRRIARPTPALHYSGCAC
jgi:hypothetical protein